MSIVLPAYNEEANLLEAISRASEVAGRLCADHEIIVVDDGSLDGTVGVVRDVARADSRVRLVCHARNLGYGEALDSGFRSARFELVFYTDSDNQFDLNELDGFCRAADEVPIQSADELDARLRQLSPAAIVVGERGAGIAVRLGTSRRLGEGRLDGQPHDLCPSALDVTRALTASAHGATAFTTR
jgi:glycosyltransferase involved in cell wall biosynthesis